MDLTRRTFLKLCSAAPMVAAAPSLLFASQDKKLSTGVRHIGNVRETIIENIMFDQYIVRYDVLCGTKSKDRIVLDKMYGMDLRINDLDELPSKRQEILQILTRDMKQDGADFSTITSDSFKLGDTIRI